MPTPADRAASKAQDKKLKGVKPTASELAAAKSGARADKQTAAEMRHMGMKKGGKVKRYADGGPVSIMDNQDEEMRALMEANLAAVRRREAEEMAAKAAPKPKPRAAAPTKKAEAPAKKAEAPAKKVEAPAKNKMAPGRSSADNRAAVKSGIKAIAGLPGRAARALESANEQTKMQGRKMAAARAKSPNLFEQMMEAANPYKKAAGGKVSSRGDGIARKGKTKGKMI
jgi:hypothetical protein